MRVCVCVHFEGNQEDPPEPVHGEGEEENSAGNCQLDVDKTGEGAAALVILHKISSFILNPSTGSYGLFL